jgi:HD-GYP domain-containing protein (c-di-GMP phosphodiesterase class II)
MIESPENKLAIPLPAAKLNIRNNVYCGLLVPFYAQLPPVERGLRALYAKDNGITYNHSFQTAYKLIDLAYNEVNETDIELLPICILGPLLHDIGKIDIPTPLLLKNGPLEPEEREVFSKHSQGSVDFVVNNKVVNNNVDILVAAFVGAHHFYSPNSPIDLNQLRNRLWICYGEIPTFSLIFHRLLMYFSLIDVYDAVTDPRRPYRPALNDPEHIKKVLDRSLMPYNKFKQVHSGNEGEWLYEENRGMIDRILERHCRFGNKCDTTQEELSKHPVYSRYELIYN